MRNEAAFATLAGVAPIPASSRQTVRYRLNRSGDRQLNRALHTIVLSRLMHDPRTKAYASRRTAEGKMPREINGASNEPSPARYIDSSRPPRRPTTTPTPAPPSQADQHHTTQLRGTPRIH
jgi:hypothetical protein